MTEPIDYSNMTPEETQAYLAQGDSNETTPDHPDDSEAGINVDFNLDDEYKPQPLLAGGNFRANIVGVAHEASKHNIAFKVCFVENGGMLSDGATPVDGTNDYYRVWLPKPGDENEYEANGKVTKRQGKINRMTLFARGLGVNMNTPNIIAQAIIEQTWIGIPVIVTVELEEYQGIMRNKLSRMVLDKSRV